jgi:hypothetical protein
MFFSVSVCEITVVSELSGFGDGGPEAASVSKVVELLTGIKK